MISDCKILRDFSMEIDKMEDEFQLMYFASIIVDGAFDFFKIERKVSNVGRPPFDLKDMIKLIFYGYVNKITSTVTLSYNARYNMLYNIISHGLEPSDRTIRDYCKYFQSIYQLIMSFILIFPSHPSNSNLLILNYMESALIFSGFKFKLVRI